MNRNGINKRKKVVALVGLAMIMLMFVISIMPLFAQEEEGGEGDKVASKGGKKSMFELFKETGPVGLIILACSITGTALTIQYAVNMTEEKLFPQQLVSQTEELLAAQEIDEAYQLCSANKNYFCNIMAGALERAFGGYEEVRAGLAETSASEKFKLDAKINVLSLIGNLGPLIGLLGTVTGMIASFQVIATLKNPTPKDLATGVYEALVNTTMGLFVAIVFLTATFILKNKVSSLTLKINTTATDIVARTISPEAKKAAQEAQ